MRETKVTGGIPVTTGRRRRRTLGALAAVLLLAAAGGSAAAQTAPPSATPRAPAAAPVPFGPGEEMSYTVRASWAVVRGGGRARLAVEGLDTIRGRDAYRLAFEIEGGIAFLGIDDVQRSWLDTERLHAHRFQQQLDQTFYERDRTLDFLPETMRWEQVGKPSNTGPLATSLPLDDVSFLYFVRAMPLAVGESRTLNRYFKEDGNPVIVRVLRKEKVTVPYGTFDALVVQPVVQTDGLFREDGQALIWLSDDDRRLLLKLEATAKGGVGLRIELESYTPGRSLTAGG